MEKIVEASTKCNKCNSKDFDLVEVWTDHTIVWRVENGKFDRNDGIVEMGGPDHVECYCHNCGHMRRLRGISQIDYAIKDLTN